ncbi:expressed unknown protein [Seminavis robusta]|uniref:Uncharacterized protein n=1 Tax=Seminavis robusta TaxID=568900 RepID=A0A9N8I168_9STRA|nr:expressed unknown protein [Seminavis robusta]|eukprot:Sro3198_g345041.1  (134) ;mRNA; f:6279-6680
MPTILITTSPEEFLLDRPCPTLFPCHLRQWCIKAERIATDLDDISVRSHTVELVGERAMAAHEESSDDEEEMCTIIRDNFVGFITSCELRMNGWDQHKKRRRRHNNRRNSMASTCTVQSAGTIATLTSCGAHS